MSLRLFHISEENNIEPFLPRISKKQWNYEKYVWAINEEKLHNYLLPRECPRICINLEKIKKPVDWLTVFSLEKQKAVIFIPNNWVAKAQNRTLLRYEFDKNNFSLIDEIAGYYVSRSIEHPIHKVELKNCEQELVNSKIKLIPLDKINMIEIKEKVLNELESFSIIKWSNIE